jgi:hypothetical protein
MELWQMDVMGRLHLVDGRECKVVTGIDDHSRFVVCAKIVGRAAARPPGPGVSDAGDGRRPEPTRHILGDTADSAEFADDVNRVPWRTL